MAAEIDYEQGVAHCTEMFERGIAARARKMRTSIPRYWLEDNNGEHMVFVLVGTRKDGDGPDPKSWLCDLQLTAANNACSQLCLMEHKWHDRGTTEESGDALWYGYCFGTENWERIQVALFGLLGEPGTAPSRLKDVLAE